jgi:hypothetical protein
MVNPRFSQLLALARAGDEASVAQLWHEFGFDFHAEVLPSDSLGCSSSKAGGENCLSSDICPLSSGLLEGGI